VITITTSEPKDRTHTIKFEVSDIGDDELAEFTAALGSTSGSGLYETYRTLHDYVDRIGLEEKYDYYMDRYDRD
jgi:hypothetical protein